MRFSSVALSVLLGVTSTSFVVGFAPKPFAKTRTTTTTCLNVVSSEPSSFLTTTSSGRNKDEIAQELASGKLLEGGQVIDFAAVKGESKAEAALADARRAVVDGTAVLSDEFLLGINQEVIQEVGHDLGTFADAKTVQEVGAYLRSKAPRGYFKDMDDDDDSVSFNPAEEAKYKSILRKAFEESGEVTSAFAKTFYLGTQLMPEEAREAIWAVYVWCRRTDEIVDAPRDNEEEMLYDLSSWEIRLENIWKYGAVKDVLDLCLLDVRIRYPNLDITPFVDMIRGMLMDVPDLGQDRYETFDELHLYCYRVAGTVGLMSMPIFGCAPGYNEDTAREPALSLGVAFQLTNILRDVGEDARQRGRIYLPREDMAKFGVTEEQIMAQRVDENYRRMMKYQIERARSYYDRARRGVFMLAEESRLPVQSSLDAYSMILDKIEENQYDSLTTRAYTTKMEKFAVLPFSWYRTLDISKDLPIPGDRPFNVQV